MAHPQMALSMLLLAMVLLIALNSVSSTRTAPCAKRPPAPKRHRPPPRAISHTLTIFGDAWTDDGTNEFPLTDYTVPNPALYSRGRISDGAVWPQLMAGLSKGKVTKVLSYAFAGAYVCQQIDIIDLALGPDPLNMQPLTLGNQTSLYLTQRAAARAGVQNTAIISFAFNDLLHILQSGSVASVASLTQVLLGCITDSVTRLAAAGETHIVVANFAPLELVPILAMASAAQLAALPAAQQVINLALASAISALQATLPTTKVYLLDFHTLFGAVHAAAAAGNVTVLTRPCITTVPLLSASWYGRFSPNVTSTLCTSGGAGYFWFDRLNPTTSTHSSIAAAITLQLHKWGLY